MINKSIWHYIFLVSIRFYLPYYKLYHTKRILFMYIGEISAIVASIIWATGATFFTLAVRNIGPYKLNLIRLNLAFLFLLIIQIITNRTLLPPEANSDHILWLAISGIIGLVIGDLCYFGALRFIGVRITMLFFTLAPPFAALSEWLILGDAISKGAISGMIIVIFGIIIVIKQKGKENKSISKIGILLATLAAICQGLGLTISKLGIGSLSAIDATYIRMMAATTSFILFYLLFFRFLPEYKNNKGNITYIYAFFGAFFGPFLGVILSMNAIKYTYSGIAQTLLSLTPITIIPFSIFVFKEKINLQTIIGTLVALSGVAILIHFK